MVKQTNRSSQRVTGNNMSSVYESVKWRRGEAERYLLVVRLQDVVEPGGLSQFAQLHLHTLQSAGQLLLLRGVQLLQDRTRGQRSLEAAQSEGRSRAVV